MRPCANVTLKVLQGYLSDGGLGAWLEVPDEYECVDTATVEQKSEYVCIELSGLASDWVVSAVTGQTYLPHP